MDNLQKSKLKQMIEGYNKYTNTPVTNGIIPEIPKSIDTPEEFKSASDRFKAINKLSPENKDAFSREMDLIKSQKQQEELDYLDLTRQMGETPEEKLDAENKYQKLKKLLGQ